MTCPNCERMRGALVAAANTLARAEGLSEVNIAVHDAWVLLREAAALSPASEQHDVNEDAVERVATAIGRVFALEAGEQLTSDWTIHTEPCEDAEDERLKALVFETARAAIAALGDPAAGVRSNR